MPIPVNCPSCGTGLKAPDSAAGKKVKCPKCATPFPVPNPGEEPMAVTAAAPAPPVVRPAAPPQHHGEGYGDEPMYRDRPPRRDAYGPGGGPTTGLQMGMGIASLALGASALVVAWIPCIGAFSWPISGIGVVLGIVGLIVAFTKQGSGLAFPIAGSATSLVALGLALYWIFVIQRATSELNRAAQEFRQGFEKAGKEWERQAKQWKPGGGGPLVPSGVVQLIGGKGEVNGALTANDPHDKVKTLSPAKLYTVDLAAGKTYVIDMMSKEMDSYLRLENAQGVELARDDDSGGFPNARITFTCTQADTYRLIATCVGPGRGNFTLRVEQK
jgi:hypothetical protein